jgi:hypothetical protein
MVERGWGGERSASSSDTSNSCGAHARVGPTSAGTIRDAGCAVGVCPRPPNSRAWSFGDFRQGAPPVPSPAGGSSPRARAAVSVTGRSALAAGPESRLPMAACSHYEHSVTRGGRQRLYHGLPSIISAGRRGSSKVRFQKHMLTWIGQALILLGYVGGRCAIVVCTRA